MWDDNKDSSEDEGDEGKSYFSTEMWIQID